MTTIVERIDEELGALQEEHDRILNAWQIQWEALTIGERLGSGSFGDVFSGYWGHIKVAIKILHRPIVSSFSINVQALRYLTMMWISGRRAGSKCGRGLLRRSFFHETNSSS